MSDQKHHTHAGHSPSTAEKIGTFLSNYRTVLIVVAVVIFVGIFAAIGLSQYLNVRSERSAAVAEEIQDLWNEWSATVSDGDSTEDEASPADDTALRDAIAAAREEFPGQYAELRALYILGQLEWELENYDAAGEAFLELAETFDDTYITPVALANAAAAAEETGEIDRARELFGRIVSLENVANLERSHALFNLGRLAEVQEEYDLALDYYNQLLDEHGDSNWTNLGRNRIIWLTSQGVATDS
ncbi:MAG: tetratricopeptide repeat protein [Alkalispirochaeta sp.]